MLFDKEELNHEIEHDFAVWAKRVRLASKLRTMRMARCQDGEAFIILAQNPDLRSDVKLDIQLVEADRVTDYELQSDGSSVDGITFDRFGNPKTYKVLKNHPGGTQSFGTEAMIVKAENMIHCFRQDRPEQHRGIPEITSALPLFAHLRRFTLAVVSAAEAAADFAGVLYTDAPANGEAETVEAAMKDMDMPLRVVLGECMRIEGMNVPRSFDNDAIKAAFSTVSLPGILSNVANKKLLQAYNAQPIIATRLCTTGDLTDFKENQRFRLTDVGDLQPVGADGEIKDSALTEEAAKNQLDTYAKKFCLTRKMIINDDLGAFLKVPTAMGNRAARLVDQLFFKRLMSNPTCVDGKPLFGRDHKNLLSGANSALSADSLKKAIQMFIDQTDADGQPISVEPSILLVPTALKHLAIELTRGATLMMSGGADNTIRPAINVLADENLAIVSSPYLGNKNYPNFSEASWYLFGKPGTVDTFEIGYLKGKRTPTVERGDLDFNVLGVWFRVYFDIGIREQDHRGMVKATGTAS